MKKSLLATGASGLIGTRFVELYQNEYDVANIDLTTGVDITEIESIRAFVASHKSEVLIHLAAFTDTNRAAQENGDKHGVCYKVNVQGTANIAKVCQENGIHLIHVSTDFVFDGNKNSPYLESDATSPIEWYGETKAMAEQVAIESGVSYSIARLSYPYRADYTIKPDLIKKIRTGLKSNKLYPQFTDTIITPTFIDDIARAFDRLVELKPKGIFHTVGSDALSPYDLARKIAIAYGFDPAVIKGGSLTEYLKTVARPYARTVNMSNQQSSSTLGLHFMTIDEGLSEIKRQQGL